MQVSPATTVIPLGPKVSFEEACTLPLACSSHVTLSTAPPTNVLCTPVMTAAIGLYKRLGLPTPENRPPSPIPVVIYGASSVVGSYAVQLAKLSNLRVIGIAGASADIPRELGADEGNANINSCAILLKSQSRLYIYMLTMLHLIYSHRLSRENTLAAGLCDRRRARRPRLLRALRIRLHFHRRLRPHAGQGARASRRVLNDGARERRGSRLAAPEIGDACGADGRPHGTRRERGICGPSVQAARCVDRGREVPGEQGMIMDW